MSLFERLWKTFLSEGKVDNICYGFGKYVNTFFNQGGRAWVQVTGFVLGGKDEFACLYLRFGGKGLEFGRGMWRGNLHTGTTYSLKDGSDLIPKVFAKSLRSEQLGRGLALDL